MPYNDLNSVICLMAPTASGKTNLAYDLYDTGRYELISVDSALIYQGMNIGTAKPTKAELERYPHHLVNIIDPTQSYSVAEFVNDIQRLIDQIHQQNKIPLLVGGSMMYFMALFDGISNVPDSDPDIRQQVDAWRQAEGNQALYDYLASIDPISHQRLNVGDTQRITRAIEVFKQTNQPISYWQAQPRRALAKQGNQQWYGLAVMPDRQWLHERIAQRLQIMWQTGLIEEVVSLLQTYVLTPDMPSMRSVGYRQVLECLVHIKHPILNEPHLDTKKFYQAFTTDDDLHSENLETNIAMMNTASLLKLNNDTVQMACLQMQNKALYATRQLAKRQYTWLRKLIKLPNSAVIHSPKQTTTPNGSMLANGLNTSRQPIISTFTCIEQVKKYLK